MNLDCTKLNKWLSNLDSLERVDLDRDAEGGVGTLSLTFGSPSGGEFEDVDLTIVFTEPITYHLPNYKPDTQFQVCLCNESEAKELLPYPDVYNQYELVLRLILNNTPSPFYVHADSLTWELTGYGPIKPEREFIGYNAEDIPEPYEGYTDDVLKAIRKLF